MIFFKLNLLCKSLPVKENIPHHITSFTSETSGALIIITEHNIQWQDLREGETGARCVHFFLLEKEEEKLGLKYITFSFYFMFFLI